MNVFVVLNEKEVNTEELSKHLGMEVNQALLWKGGTVVLLIQGEKEEIFAMLGALGLYAKEVKKS